MRSGSCPKGSISSHKLMRLQARPKILLCRTFEEAWERFDRYEENVLGVISDIEFPKGGELSPTAGVEFARRVRARQSDVPVMLQSSRPDNEALARAVGASFLLKDSPTLLHDLRRFMVDHFGFGDFVFRLPDGTEVARAHDLRDARRKAPHGAGREPGVPRGAQSLLEVAQGADRVRRGAPPAAAPDAGFSDGRAPARGADPIDPGLPRETQPRRHRRLRPRHVRSRRQLLADRRRIARRQGARPGVREPSPQRARR